MNTAPIHKHAFLQGGGKLGELTRTYDWSKTSVGSPDHWPPGLCTTLGLLLHAASPMVLFWGEEFLCFYNDAVQSGFDAAGKHPAVGQRGAAVWPGTWERIEPLLTHVTETGESVSDRSPLVPLTHNDSDDTYWTFTYHPVYGDTNQISGVLVTALETTGDVTTVDSLRASEQRLRSLVLEAPVAMGLFVGTTHRIEVANTALLRYWGKDESVLGRPYREAVPELEEQGVFAILDKVFVTGDVYEGKATPANLYSDGKWSTHYVDLTFRPLRNADGNIYGILNTAVDVTERVFSQQQQMEKVQREVLTSFEQSPAAIAIITGLDLRFQMANPFYGELVGRSPDQLIGKTLLDALPELTGQGFDQLLRQVIDTGNAYIAREVAVNIIRKKGPETIYVDLTYQPRREADDHVSGVFVVATDVTAQVLSRKEIEASEAKLRSLVESAPFPIGVYVGKEMVIQLANQSIIDVWGKGSDVIGKRYADILPELANQHIYAQLDQVFTTGIPFHAHNQRVDLVIDGVLQPYYFKYSFTPLYDADGRVYGVMNTAADVTDLMLARQKLEESEARLRSLSTELDAQVQQRTQELAAINEELREANVLLVRSNHNLEQFAYIASHDLQEPLRKIQQFGDLLQTRYGHQLNEGMAYLERMRAAASRMSMLIRDLLNFSRISTGQEVDTRVALDLVVNAVLADLELTIQETGTVIHIESLPTVPGDVSQLGQLFQNLLSNAIKFRRPDVAPIIRITTQAVAAADLPPQVKPTRTAAVYSRIDVIDNGIGFDEKYLDRIFQVFQRLHGKGQYAGTGIGLAVCEKVATNHGGAITASSQPGQGATFSVYLPN
ncbi:PAS domain-containing sensor histidine kinase [Spirosoma fluminis]